MIKYIIICLFVFISGFVDSVAGGGGLISFPGFLIAGVPVRTAIATTKLTGFPGSLVATVRFAKNGYIKFKLAIFWAICTCVGGVIGAKISLLLEETIIKKMMLVILPIVAFFVLKDKKDDKKDKNPNNTCLYLIGGIASFLIGLYNGIYGPGAGTFFILSYSGAVGLKMKDSVGISKFVNFAADVSALLMYSLGGTVDFKLGITASLFCMAGSYVGSGLVLSNGQKIVRPFIIFVLIMLSVKVIVAF